VAQDPPLHPNVEPLEFLLGTWEGRSEGLWIPDRRVVFRDRMEFGHVGNPALSFRQQTWLDDGRASHGESGYLAIDEHGVVTWTIAEPSGVVEVHTGRAHGTELEMRCVAIGRASDAINVTAVERELEVDGDQLSYRIRIAMNDEAPADHIVGVLRRAVPAAG
jgi:hypothetical protein